MEMGMGVWILLFSVVTLISKLSLALTPDGVALLELKSSLNDSKNLLSNWIDSDASPCHWTGISCSPRDQRVISINLPYMELGLIYLSMNMGLLLPRDLSSNSLKGAIPSSLGRLKRLRYLNLSTNFLSGEVPDFGTLSTFGRKSFIGNLDLCGQQVSKPCRTSLGFPAVLPHAGSDQAAVPSKRSSRYIKGAVIGAMSALGFAFILLLGFLWLRLLTKKERAAKRYTEVKKQVHQQPSAKLITFHGDLPYPSCELVEKIESLNEEDVVGAGGFGTVYRMVMNDCGTFAVKKIDRTREGCDETFERELEILGSIKHINLVNLRGYCRLPTAKLLIYDYLAMGSLDDLLHERVDDRTLNWNARLRIAFGSAKGLAYLHHDCCPKIIHRDIKSSNILLDENLEPHVSDFGLAKLLVDEDAHVTTVVAGTFGYLAPEYLQSGRATEKSDVYSFGVLLLELVTGKRPTDPSFVKRGLNVVGWINTLLKENWMEDVVDKKCGNADAETVEAIVEIAARCTDANPDNRPTMHQVLQFLELEVMSPCPSDFYESHSDKS
ncbi:LRR receptor-like serine/threonine-protein kinase FEI 1 [Olea europaea var. sylvestris]|uniref:LRR receptor-like serine/threonine-protein kinase FEI 1 n=1 Tax=Olea europaea var. sylvestris TaxID=158386 RepID=UPI000C1D1E63|nr:LRR receptor-like serine/threonine-protein kinase FEI 1 [Olea europaea var. sylvestris]